VIVALALPSLTKLCSALHTVGIALLDSNASGGSDCALPSLFCAVFLREELVAPLLIPQRA
jgi:hypothetical protein